MKKLLKDFLLLSLSGYITALCAVIILVVGFVKYETEFPTREFFSTEMNRGIQDIRFRISLALDNDNEKKDLWGPFYNDSITASLSKGLIKKDTKDIFFIPTKLLEDGYGKLIAGEIEIISDFMVTIGNSSESQATLTKKAVYKLMDEGLDPIACPTARENNMLPFDKVGIIAGYVGDSLSKK